MRQVLDLTGKTFGSLTVTALSPDRTSDGMVVWFCNCACGTKNRPVRATNLRSGRSKTCGCSRRKVRRREAEPGQHRKREPAEGGLG